MENGEQNKIWIERITEPFNKAIARIVRVDPSVSSLEEYDKCLCGAINNFPYPWEARALNAALDELEKSA